VEAWERQPEPLPLQPPGRAGEDRLRLAFGIDSEGQLTLRVHDLAAADPTGDTSEDPARLLGPVR
jgi:hypothetical protein